MTDSAAAEAAALRSSESPPIIFLRSLATFLALEDSAALPGTLLSLPSFGVESSSFVSSSLGGGCEGSGCCYGYGYGYLGFSSSSSSLKGDVFFIEHGDSEGTYLITSSL